MAAYELRLDTWNRGAANLVIPGQPTALLGFDELVLQLDGATGQGEPHADLSIWNTAGKCVGLVRGLRSMQGVDQPVLQSTIVNTRVVYFAATSTSVAKADVLWFYPDVNL
jgi:hypothetical protein